MRISDWSSDVCSSDLLGEDVEKGLADRSGEGEIRFEIAIQMIVEDAAHATMHLAVGDVEIIVRPLLESRIMLRVMGVAGPLHRCVEIGRVVIIGNWRVEIGPAAEPALRRCKIGSASCRERVCQYV